jgi:hypothetical protein
MASNDSLSTPDVRTVTPTDAQIRFQFYFIRSQHLLKPLGFQKMLDALKAEEPTWILGPGRLKRLLKSIAEEEAKEEKEREAAGPYIKLTAGHSQALRDQIAWQDKSIRCEFQPSALHSLTSWHRHYRIIGHDGYDYASTPNSDMGILLNVRRTIHWHIGV